MHRSRRIFQRSSCLGMIQGKMGRQGSSYVQSRQYKSSTSNLARLREENPTWYLGFAASVGLVAGLSYSLPSARRSPIYAEEDEEEGEEEEDHFQAGEEQEGLRVVTKEELGKHKTKEDRIWVSYRAGVYDITDFVENHPGGDKILLAAGGSLEGFWNIYTVHKSSASVQRMLEEYRIGNLAPSDRLTQADLDSLDAARGQEGQPFALEPQRLPIFAVRSSRPFNAEPPLPLLAGDFRTPNSMFYVRNHMEVPLIDPADWQLEVIAFPGKEPMRFTLEDLKRDFKQHTIDATLQCTGNRRAEMSRGSGRAVKGLEWEQGAISNAQWKGVLLRDVLRKAGIESIDDARAHGVLHLQFEGLDGDSRGRSFGYGASVPMELALNGESDAMLAWEMNGEALPRDHGFPVRVIIPGNTAARCVKWIGRITGSPNESGSQWQRKDYKSFSPSIDWNNVDWDAAPSIQDCPVQSAICEPRNGTVLPAGTDTVTLKGYAWSGGGRGIIRVDISIDGGATWHVAELTDKPEYRGYNRSWAWTLWEANIPVPADTSKPLRVCCKAVDSAYHTQPESPSPIWNLRGVLNNAWHKIELRVADEGGSA